MEVIIVAVCIRVKFDNDYVVALHTIIFEDNSLVYFPLMIQFEETSEEEVLFRIMNICMQEITCSFWKLC